MAVKRFFKMAGIWCKKHAGKIFAGCAIVSEVVGYWLMHKEAPIVRDRLEALPEDAKWTDKLRAAGPVYLPAFGMLLLSSGCIVGGCIAGERKAAVLTSLYTASETALRQFEQKAVEKLGRDKVQEIHDAVAQDIMNETPPEMGVVYETGNGSKLIYDPLSGRYFRSDPIKIIGSMNKMNNQIRCEMFVSANEWFNEIGLESIGLGDLWGWNTDNMIDIPDEVDRWSTTQSPTNEPCFILTYYNRPVLYK